MNHPHTLSPCRLLRSSSGLRGSLSLSLLASLTGGLLFTLLFANFVRFLIASNALERAAVKAARCLSPSDAPCVELLGKPNDEELNWFAARRAEVETVSADRYNYSGEVVLQDWELKGKGFEVHVVERPPIQWTASQVPLRTFRSELNAFESREKIIEARVLAEVSEQIYRVPTVFPKGISYFPAFDQAYEMATDQDAISSWNPRLPDESRQPNRGFLDFRELSFQEERIQPRVIRAGEVERFESSLIEVPTLAKESPGVPCLDGEGHPCNILPYSGTVAPSNYSWDRYAALAIKAFSEIRRLQGSPRVAWAGAPGAEGKHWGLQVELISAAEFQAYKKALQAAEQGSGPRPEAPRGELRCLGGRSALDVLPQNTSQPFHLWLRGPKGGNGGGEPNCPITQNALHPAHDSLFVERGGAYRITGFLQVEGTGAVSAQVVLKHYFDSYSPDRLLRASERTCKAKVPSSRHESSSSCTAPVDCGGLKVLSTLACRVLAVESSPLCLSEEEASGNEFAFPISRIACEPPQQGLSCREHDRPSAPTDCSRQLRENPARISCGWRSRHTEDRLIELPAALPNCPLAHTVEKTAPCDPPNTWRLYQSHDNYGPPESCPLLARIRSAYQNALDGVEGKHFGETVVAADLLSKTVWTQGKVQNSRWAPAFSLPAELKAAPRDSTLVREADLELRNSLRILKHEDPNWTPSLEAFGFISGAESEGAAQLRLVSERTEKVESVYPFREKAELEIPRTLVGQECDGEIQPLEHRLRVYAAQEIPELSDPRVVFHGTAQFVESTVVSRSGSCNAEEDFSLPARECTPLHPSERQPVLCEQRIFLGQFPRELTPDGPPLCHSHPKIQCFSSQTATSTLFPGFAASELNSLAAEQSGQQEMQRVFPTTTLSCNGPNCLRVAISDEDTDHVQVAVDFELPLGFPLRNFLGQDSLLLHRERRELREIRGVDRFSPTGDLS